MSILYRHPLHLRALSRFPPRALNVDCFSTFTKMFRHHIVVVVLCVFLCVFVLFFFIVFLFLESEKVATNVTNPKHNIFDLCMAG